MSNRKKILILSPYPIYPCLNAGANRIFTISNELSKHYNIVHFSQCVNLKMFLSRLKGGNDYSFIRINNNYKIIQSYNLFYNIVLFITSRINAQNFLASFTLNTHVSNQLKRELRDISLLQVEHPWQYKWAKKISYNKKIPTILSIHNIESDVLKTSVPKIPVKKLLLKYLKKFELNMYREAENIIFLSELDKQYFNSKFKVTNNSTIIPLTVKDDLFNIKRAFSNTGILKVLFTGSYWKPNIQALGFIEDLALSNSTNKKIQFIIAGSVGKKMKSRGNIFYTGEIEDITPYFKEAHIFINPMTLGSGVNFKMIEAMACGLPIITTAFGARGLKLINNYNAIITSLDRFSNAINDLSSNIKRMEILAINARRTANKEYSNKVLKKKLVYYYHSILDK